MRKTLALLLATALLPSLCGARTNGVVTAVLEGGIFILDDGRRSRQCICPNRPKLNVGDTLEYRTLSPPTCSDGISVVHDPHIVARNVAIPPLRLSVDKLAAGGHDFATVETEGVVEEVFQDEIDSRWYHFRLLGERDSLLISFQKGTLPQDLLATLPNARVRLIGVFFPRMPGRRIPTGPRIVVRNATDVRILTPAPDDPLDYPPLAPDQLTDARSICRLGRHSVTGVVLAVWGGSHAFVDAYDFKVRLDLSETAALPRPGDVVKAAGRPETDLFHPILSSARLRVLERRPEAVEAVAETLPPEQLHIRLDNRLGYNDKLFGSAARIEGVVQNVLSPLFAHTPWNLRLDDGSTLSVDTSACPEAIAGLESDTRISVSGIIIPTTEIWRPSEPFPRVTGITLVPRAAADITVLAQPPWWTAGRLLVLVGILLVVLALLVVWHFIARANNAAKIRERTRLAVELHDSLSQNLTGLAFQIATTKSALAEDPSAIGRQLETAERMLLSSRTELKRCLWDLRRNTLEDRDFAHAIRQTLEPIPGLSAAIRFPVSRQELDDTTAHNVLCIIRELAANAIRHGKARHVRIAGECHDGRLSFSVRDDGSGFDPGRRPCGTTGHFGLDGVAERVERFDGRIEIRSAPGKGAHVVITDIKL